MKVPLFLAWIGTLVLLIWTVSAKEIEATNEWQLLGENDTIPAGMHVRMDMTTGEKWVKLPDDDDGDGPTTTSMAAAIVSTDGSVDMDNDGNHDMHRPKYDFEMMHRTLSKLPPEEMERYGGLPELPDSNPKRTVLTSQERQAFEKRMAKIWDQRQAELKELQAMLMDLPEVLKERIRGIQQYLKDPLEELRKVNLEKEQDGEGQGMVTDIISLLTDLEFQLTDVDNARDFHTLGGWELVVALLSEDMHVQNKTISKLSRATETKVRAVQSHAAWTIGTAVKNTGEFYPYAVEAVKVGTKMTTALDMLLDVFCKNYKDEQWWPIRTLLAKSIYAIGSLLRGNRLAQAHLIQNDGAAKLCDKLRQLVMDRLSSDVKLIQRLLSLASDLIIDIQMDGDKSSTLLNDAIVKAFSTVEWCNVVSTVFITETLLPIRVQETVMETFSTLAPHCSSKGWDAKSMEHKNAIQRFQDGWQQNSDDFDPEHLKQLNQQAIQVTSLL